MHGIGLQGISLSFVDYLHLLFLFLANKDFISLASFAQSVLLQLSSLFRTVGLCAVNPSQPNVHIGPPPKNASGFPIN